MNLFSRREILKARAILEIEAIKDELLHVGLPDNYNWLDDFEELTWYAGLLSEELESGMLDSLEELLYLVAKIEGGKWQ